MSAAAVRTEAQRFLLALLGAELIRDYRTPVIQRSNRIARVTWPTNPGSRGLVVPGQFGSVPEYRRMLQDQEFSAVLVDGSLLQLSWTFVDDELVRHRLCYYPCPIELDSDYSEGTSPLIDLVDEHLLEDFALEMAGRNFYEDPPGGEFPLLRLRSPVRFDFDVDAAAPEHPASHMTIVREDCRIPVHGPVSLGHFVRLVFRHFYPDLWRQHAFLREWALAHRSTTITAGELPEVHLAWRATL